MKIRNQKSEVRTQKSKIRNPRSTIRNLYVVLLLSLFIYPAIASAETREFVLTITDEKVDLDGNEFMVWLYNKKMPGPEIRVTEGDTVRIRLMNKSSAPHALLFHGLKLPPRVAMQEEIPVNPDYEYVYEFPATPAGSHYYHCNVNMAEHVSRGMYGAFIVEAKDEKRYDKELVYLFMDWSEKDAKGAGPYQTGHPRTLVDRKITTINNHVIKSNDPIIEKVKVGESVRIRLMNVGFLPHRLRFEDKFIITHNDGYPISDPSKEEMELTVYPGKRHDIVLSPAKSGKMQVYHSVNLPPGAMEKWNEKEHGHKPKPRKGARELQKEKLAVVFDVKK